MARAPGSVRDSILKFMTKKREASVAEIRDAVSKDIGEVPDSSVRSYLNLNVPDVFERTGRGHYRLKKNS